MLAAAVIEEEGRKQEVARWRMGCMCCGGGDDDDGQHNAVALKGRPLNALKCCRPTSM